MEAESGKLNALISSISHLPNIDKMYLHFKDLYGTKYQLLINKPESVDLRYCNDYTLFIKKSNHMDDTYENT